MKGVSLKVIAYCLPLSLFGSQEISGKVECPYISNVRQTVIVNTAQSTLWNYLQGKLKHHFDCEYVKGIGAIPDSEEIKDLKKHVKTITLDLNYGKQGECMYITNKCAKDNEKCEEAGFFLIGCQNIY